MLAEGVVGNKLFFTKSEPEVIDTVPLIIEPVKKFQGIRATNINMGKIRMVELGISLVKRIV